MNTPNKSAYFDPWGAPRDGVVTNPIPRDELLFMNRAAIKDSVDHQNAVTLANPEQAELPEQSTFEMRTGQIAVVDTVEVAKFL